MSNEVRSTNQRSCNGPHQLWQVDGRTVSTSLTADCAAMEPARAVPMQQAIGKGQETKLTQGKEQAELELVARRPGSVLENIVEYVSETFSCDNFMVKVSRMPKRHDSTRKGGTRVSLQHNADKGLQFLEDIRSSFPLVGSIFALLASG